jgi:hypothetical protein
MKTRWLGYSIVVKKRGFLIQCMKMKQGDSFLQVLSKCMSENDIKVIRRLIAEGVITEQELRDAPIVEACPRCAGCGQIADDDEGTPWRYWAELPTPENFAVLTGVVKPIPCPECSQKQD